MLFEFKGILTGLGLSGGAATVAAAYVWTKSAYALSCGYTTMSVVLKQSLIAAGCWGFMFVAIAILVAVGVAVIRKKLKMGKARFVAW